MRAINWPLVALGCSAVVSTASILWLGQRLTFWGDEWVFWLYPPAHLLQPNNEHWSTIPYLAYGLLDVLGARTYLPFMVVLAIAHVSAAGGLYRVAAPRVGRWGATGLAALLLFLGGASDNFLWAWQMGFVGSCALGLWALAALDAKRQAVGAGLLVAAIATAGPGLLMMISAIAFRPSRWLAVPVAVYCMWFVLFGRTTVASLQDPFTIEAVIAAPPFALAGVAHAVGAVLGVGTVAGAVVFSAAIAIALYLRVERLYWAALVGLVGEYVLIALVRSDIEGSHTLGRYVYPAAVFLLVMAATLFRRVTRPTFQTLVVAMLVIAITVNAISLVAAGLARTDRLTVSKPYGCLPHAVPAHAIGGWPTPTIIVPDRFRC